MKLSIESVGNRSSGSFWWTGRLKNELRTSTKKQTELENVV